MKNTTALDRVREMASSRARTLAGEVGALMREKNDADEMLKRLSDYAQDYTLGQASSCVDGSVSVMAIENRYRFVAKLNVALEQQRSRTVRIQERADQKMTSWRRACADLEALDRLAERRQKEARQREDKREQRNSDAIALRIFNAGSHDGLESD